MLIIRRIITPNILHLPFPFQKPNIFYFSTILTNKNLKIKIKQIHDKLIINNKVIKPDKLIKMLYYIHFQSQKIDKTIITQSQMDAIVQTLSSQLHTFSHQDVTLLLQTLADFPKYSHYKRSNQFMRLLLKKLNTIYVLPLNEKYIFRLLNILQKMSFPSLILNKYINIIITKTDKNTIKMTKLDILKFFITILQMKFVHIMLITKYYQKQIKNIDVKNPQELVYLYYIYRTLQKSLQNKSVYFANKIKLHDIVFNPYAQISMTSPSDNTTKTVQPNSNTTQQQLNTNDEYNQNIQRQKQKIRELSQKLILTIRKQIDVQKLKNDIYKYYGFQKYPLESATALLLVNVKEFKDILGQYFKKHYKVMGVVQFVALLYTIPQPQRQPIYTYYYNRTLNILKLSQKLTLLLSKPTYIHKKITKQQLLKCLQQCTQISIKQLSMLTKIMLQNLTPDQQIQIINIMDDIVGINFQGQDKHTKNDIAQNNQSKQKDNKQ